MERQEEKCRWRNAEKRRKQGGKRNWNVNGEHITDRFADVIVNASAVTHGLHNRGEIVVHQN